MSLSKRASQTSEDDSSQDQEAITEIYCDIICIPHGTQEAVPVINPDISKDLQYIPGPLPDMFPEVSSSQQNTQESANEINQDVSSLQQYTEESVNAINQDVSSLQQHTPDAVNVVKQDVSSEQLRFEGTDEDRTPNLEERRKPFKVIIKLNRSGIPISKRAGQTSDHNSPQAQEAISKIYREISSIGHGTQEAIPVINPHISKKLQYIPEPLPNMFPEVSSLQQNTQESVNAINQDVSSLLHHTPEAVNVVKEDVSSEQLRFEGTDEDRTPNREERRKSFKAIIKLNRSGIPFSKRTSQTSDHNSPQAKEAIAKIYRELLSIAQSTQEAVPAINIPNDQQYIPAPLPEIFPEVSSLKQCSQESVNVINQDVSSLQQYTPEAVNVVSQDVSSEQLHFGGNDENRSPNAEELRRRFPCEICDHPRARFSSAFSLKVHMRHFHKGEKLCICNICGEKFTVEKVFDQHMLDHYEKLSHQCPVCNQKFLVKEKLDLHMLEHV